MDQSEISLQLQQLEVAALFYLTFPQIDPNLGDLQNQQNLFLQNALLGVNNDLPLPQSTSQVNPLNFTQFGNFDLGSSTSTQQINWNQWDTPMQNSINNVPQPAALFGSEKVVERQSNGSNSNHHRPKKPPVRTPRQPLKQKKSVEEKISSSIELPKTLLPEFQATSFFEQTSVDGSRTRIINPSSLLGYNSLQLPIKPKQEDEVEFLCFVNRKKGVKEENGIEDNTAQSSSRGSTAHDLTNATLRSNIPSQESSPQATQSSPPMAHNQSQDQTLLRPATLNFRPREETFPNVPPIQLPNPIQFQTIFPAQQIPQDQGFTSPIVPFVPLLVSNNRIRKHEEDDEDEEPEAKRKRLPEEGSSG